MLGGNAPLSPAAERGTPAVQHPPQGLHGAHTVETSHTASCWTLIGTLMPIDEEFQKLWRSVPVDGIDDNKIEEYLGNQGIRSMQDTSEKVLPAKLKRKAAPKKRTFKRPRDNEHLKEILVDYD